MSRSGRTFIVLKETNKNHITMEIVKGMKFKCDQYNYEGTITKVGNMKISFKRNDNAWDYKANKNIIRVMRIKIDDAERNFQTGFWKEIK